jgi:hypothetical protein
MQPERAAHGVELAIRLSVPDEPISKEPMQQPLQRLHLLYHELRAGVSRYSYVVETELFERHLDLFAQLRAAKGCDLWPELTFDDGHISNYDLAAPLLQAKGLNAQFFITVGWTGTKSGYMGWNELRALHEAGFSIGAHGWTHILLTHCNEQKLQDELKKSRLTLEDRLGSSIAAISLPGGRYNRRVLAACAKAGYTQIYTSEPKIESIPPGTTIGRVNILGNMQPEWIEKLFTPESVLLSKLQRKYRIKSAAKKMLGDGLYNRIWGLVNHREPETDYGRNGAE